MKLTEKTKKYLAISGGVVVCIGLLAAISLQFAKVPAGEDVLPEESGTVTEIVVDLGGGSITGETEAAGEETEESGLVTSRIRAFSQSRQSRKRLIRRP